MQRTRTLRVDEDFANLLEEIRRHDSINSRKNKSMTETTRKLERTLRVLMQRG